MNTSAMRPPPTENTRPVTSQDSWTRYATSGAMNSGPSLSPTGPSRSSVMRVNASGAIEFALMLYLAPSIGEHVGEPDEAHLRGAVVRLAEVAEDAGRRRRVDDAAVALLAHLDERRPGDVERALQVDVDDRVDEVGRLVVERLVAQDAGVVDDDVDALEGVERGLHDRRAALDRGDRVVVGDGLAAGGLDLVDDLLRRAGVGAGAVDRRRRGRSPRRARRATRAAARAAVRGRHRRP